MISALTVAQRQILVASEEGVRFVILAQWPIFWQMLCFASGWAMTKSVRKSEIWAWFTLTLYVLLHLWNFHSVIWMFPHLIVACHNFHLFLHTYPVCVNHQVAGPWGFWHQCRGRASTHSAGIAAGTLCSFCDPHSWWSFFLLYQISSIFMPRTQ